jgi:large conductance mechanosensitive channel
MVRRLAKELSETQLVAAPLTMLGEFREFIARGNVVDLAVGVILGASFNSIVKSLVDQVIMPPVGLALGGLDFSKMEWVLRADNPATKAVEKVAIQYGAFINTIIQFLIVAWVVFLLVKAVNAVRRQYEADHPVEAKVTSEALLTEIRDLLRGDTPSAPVPPPMPTKTPVRRRA